MCEKGPFESKRKSGAMFEAFHELTLDSFFCKWLTDDDNSRLFEYIDEFGEEFERGDPVEFDFSIFETCKRVNPLQAPTRPLGASVSLLHLPFINRIKQENSLPEMLYIRGQRIPDFYKTENNDDEMRAIEARFKDVCNEADVSEVLNKYCHFPVCFGEVFVDKHKFGGREFVAFWKENFIGWDYNTRFFNMLTFGQDRDYIFPSDLVPYVSVVVRTHKSLSFLLSESSFLEKFVDFIITRMFYNIDSELRGTLSLQQFRKFDIISEFYEAEKMEDVNSTHRMFNYQHFYVTFCKFWELDGDSDGYLTEEEMGKYNSSSISPMVIRRYLCASFYPRDSSRNPKFNFTQFAYFLMSVEDKTSRTATNFWFKLCDLDDDGALSMREIEYIYYSMHERMRNNGQETVPFTDVIKQLLDMVNPDGHPWITLEDLLKTKMGEQFFNSLVDLQQFLMKEYGYSSGKQDDDYTSQLTPWEYFVMVEYEMLSQE